MSSEHLFAIAGRRKRDYFLKIALGTRLTKGTFVSIKSIEVGFLGFLWLAAFIIKTLRPQLS